MTTFSDDIADGYSAAQSFSFTVDEKYLGLRLDQFLAYKLREISRSQLAAGVSKGHVRVGEKKQKNSYRLKAGDRITGKIVVEEEVEIVAEKIDFDVLFEDSHLLVISKPPGLIVHPGSGNPRGTLVNGLLYYCHGIKKVGEHIRPGIVHRLDKDTSGIMVVAKKNDVHRKLSSYFKERQVKKQYLALVHGILEKKEGRIVAAIGRHAVNRQKMAVRDNSGRYAASNWKVIKEFEEKYSLVEVVIETGRTHQIRVHMAYLGHPVTGDQVYGRRNKNLSFPRQMLHARRLIFFHPVDDTKMDIQAPLWPDFSEIVNSLSTS